MQIILRPHKSKDIDTLSCWRAMVIGVLVKHVVTGKRNSKAGICQMALTSDVSVPKSCCLIQLRKGLLSEGVFLA